MNDKKKRNKKGVPIAVIAIATTIIIVTVAFFIPKNDGSFNYKSLNAYFQVRTFLRSVINEKYEKAFNYVYYYDEFPENGTDISFNDAKKIWCDRILAAKKDNLSEYLAGYGSLDVYLENGELIAMFEAKVSVRGVERQYRTQIKFYEGKIAGISCEQVLTDFEKTISGNLSI
ncbi:MAG: hypothetical protein DBX47_03735 [Clostridiales bacterium]|nr:MAG: hypothetical protein DBX47_03735 [Clostridiales bacterium]